jgi:hypothetical protein
MKQILGAINGRKPFTILLVAFVAIGALLYRASSSAEAGTEAGAHTAGKATPAAVASSGSNRVSVGNSASTSPPAGGTGAHIYLSEPQQLSVKHDG